LVIIIYNYFHPAYKAGGPIQSLVNLVNYLQNELPFKIICENKDLDGTILDVPADQWTVYRGANVFYSSRGFKGYKRFLDDRDDVAYVNGLYSIQYNLFPALFFKGRTIVSARGMLNAQALGQKRWKKRIYLRLWNLLGLPGKCEYHATTEEESVFIKGILGKKTKVWMIPNFPNVLPRQNLPLKSPGSLILCTVALISPMKNHLLVIEALKKTTIPVVYNIYGPVKDAGYWRQCQALIATLPPNIKVHYHGQLAPAGIAEALSQSHVYIQPSKSENFGHSIFEALSAGLPVITSFNTPWNRLAERNAGINASTDGNDDLARAISFFGKMDEREFSEWNLSAGKLALQSVDIDNIKSKYLEMFSATKTAWNNAFQNGAPVEFN
jgi:glycosyltransferase involved in cell wall biosynthesis